MSIHQSKSFEKAQRLGAVSAKDFATYKELTDMSKRELAEIIIHLAALATGYYDQAPSGGR